MVSMMRRAPARSGLDRAQYVDLKLWLPGDILTKVDRTSMAVSLEAREPLLDHRLLEFAATLPDKMRVVQIGERDWADAGIRSRLRALMLGARPLESARLAQ